MEKLYLRLRGHHIDVFAQYYHAMQNGYVQYVKKQGFTPCNEPELAEYTQEFWEQVESTWKAIIEDPFLSIRTVQGLDHICRTPCPKLDSKNPLCKETIEDKAILKEFCLRPNRVYTSKELIGKIIQYKEKTGFASPRAKKNNTEIMGVFKELSKVFG